jgi:GNAT superfamily N-acetyltransferase
MGVLIKQAEVDDLEAVCELFDQYRMFYGQESNKPACNHFLFERMINHESLIYLAYLNEKPVGFVQLYPSFSSISLLPTWILNDLFVKPDARRFGVAKALINHCQQWVIQRNDKGLELSTANDNLEAQGLYEKTGFKRDAAFLHYAWSCPQE